MNFETVRTGEGHFGPPIVGELNLCGYVNELTTGEILQSPQTTREPVVSVMWRLEKYFSLPRRDQNYVICSPRFSFLGIDWRLIISSFIQNSQQTELILEMLPIMNSPKCRIYYNFGIWGTCFKKLLTCTGQKEFGRENFTVHSKVTPSLSGLSKDLYAPEGILIVYCFLSVLSKVEEAPYQREAIKGVDIALQTDVLDNTEHPAEPTDPCNSPGIHGLLQDFKSLFLNERFTDTTIKVKDNEFHVHKAVLAARSSVFAAMMEHGVKEKQNDIIEIQDCQAEIFRDFLMYLYSGQVEYISENNAIHLYKVADKYRINNLKAECTDFLMSNFSVDQFCDVVELALQYNEYEIQEKATEYFANNLDTITVSDEWQAFLKQNPVEASELYIQALKYHGVMKR